MHPEKEDAALCGLLVIKDVWLLVQAITIIVMACDKVIEGIH